MHLINDLLDLAKIEAGKLELDPRAVSASSLVSEVADSMRSLADLKHITLSMDVDSEAEHLFVDPARFKQVVYNYVSNAIKFTPDNGSVKVKVTRDPSGSVRLDVCDTGIGIDAANLPRLFQQFHQLDTGAAKRYAGTGLGLALVKRLVEQQVGMSRSGANLARAVVSPRSFLQLRPSRRYHETACRPLERSSSTTIR